MKQCMVTNCDLDVYFLCHKLLDLGQRKRCVYIVFLILLPLLTLKKKEKKKKVVPKPFQLLHMLTNCLSAADKSNTVSWDCWHEQ